MPISTFDVSSRRRALRIGFVSLIDAAPLIVARHLGLFARKGLDVELCREIGWASIRDKIIHGELEAAHAPAVALWTTQLGVDCPRCDVLTALVLSRNGNAITLAQSLRNSGVRDAESFQALAKRRGSGRRLILAVPFHYSSHLLLLSRWLMGSESMRGRRAVSESLRDVQTIVAPPSQMPQLLARGAIHGYCVGEPWNSLAVKQGMGWCVGSSAELTSELPEKVLMVRRSFAENYSREHAAIVAAIAEACEWCERPQNRYEVATLLAAPEYLNLDREVLLPALTGQFHYGNEVMQSLPDFVTFHGDELNVPTAAQAQAVQAPLIVADRISDHGAFAALSAQLFREDLHRAALAEFGSVDDLPVAQRIAG